jgi:hypothetical protein
MTMMVMTTTMMIIEEHCEGYVEVIIGQPIYTWTLPGSCPKEYDSDKNFNVRIIHKRAER